MSTPMSAYTLTPITPEDSEVLLRIYASTRTEELSAVPWSDDQKDAFLRQQFTAQHAHYHQHYPGASFDLIRVDGRPCGRLYVARWPREIRLMDIALLPDCRNTGLGGRVVDALLAEARQAGLPVTIHVERMNRALGFYERRGFRLKEDKGVYLLLEWTPQAPAEHA
ncbi:MAG: GNAT family N-acetyltransferase [Vicinamibacteria bacterium]